MAQFATAADLAARLGVTFSPDEAARADDLLTQASGVIQAAAHQAIEYIEADTLARSGTPDDTLRLPQRPVVAVSAVALDGAPVTDYWQEGASLVRPSGWGSASSTVEVTYSHGYDPVPEVIRVLALGLAARVYVNPSGVLQEAYGQERIIYGAQDAPGLMLTPGEAQAARNALGAGAGSVSLR